MEILPQLLLIIVLILINAFFSCAEIAIVSINKAKLQALIDSGNKKAIKLLELIEAPSKMLSTIQVAITLAGFFASAQAALTISEKITFLSPSLAVVFVTLILSYLTLVFGELVPKRIGLKKSLVIALNVARILDFLSKLFTPIIYILSLSTNFIVFLLGFSSDDGEENLSKEEMMAVLNTGTLEQSEKDLIENIIEFDEKLAREVMIPRPSIFAVSKDDSLSDLLKLEDITRYSRIPVYENDLDNIIGILHIKDLLLLTNYSIKVSEIMKAPFFVPDTKLIRELFLEMKTNNKHMSILIDEYGGVSGIVTLEDLLEEIVGNITDEFDKKIYDIIELGKNKYLANGELSINDLNDFLDTNFESKYYDSIGGLIIEKLGYIPEDNQSIDDILIDDYYFRIQKIKNKKIIKIIILKNKGENNNV